MGISDEDWFNFLTENSGTTFGDMARKARAPYKQLGPNYTSRKKKKVWNPELPYIEHSPPQLGKSTNKGLERRLKAKNNFFPGVDKWIDDHIKKSTQRIILLLLAVTGALIGGGLSEQLNTEVWISTILGAGAGVLVLPIIIFSIKLLLLALTLAIAGVALYIVYKMLESL